MTRTCLACRTRKMRCDGVTPECGPCSRARKPLECTYSDGTSTQRNITLLPKGAACLPCRRKKKKCNADRPFCNTCHLAGKEWECEYDEEIQQNLTTALVSRTRELEERLALYELQQQHMSQPLLLQPAPTGEFDTSFLQWHTPTPSGSAPPAHSRNPSCSTQASTSMLWDHQKDTPFAPPSDPSFWNPRVHQSKSPVPSRPPTNSPHPDRREVRTLFLAHQIHLGFYLRDAKRRAIQLGDFSGQVVHPAAIYLSQLVGSFLWRLRYGTDVHVVSEEIELRNVLDSLKALPPDPITLVTIYTILGEYMLFKRQLELGMEYWVRASQVLSIQDLRMAASNLGGPMSSHEPDEDTKETLNALGQLLYTDLATSLVLRQPRFISTEYERELRNLTITHVWLSQHCAIIMRCKSICLLIEAMRLSRIRGSISSESEPSAELDAMLPAEWQSRYWITLEDATQHVALLYPQMLQASFNADPQHTLCLKLCLVETLVAQLVMHRIPGSYHVESKQKAMCVIVEVIKLLRGLKEEDFTMLEPVVGMCSTIIARTLREDPDLLSILPPESGPPQDVLMVLISVATQLSRKIPYVEPALQTLHELAAIR